MRAAHDVDLLVVGGGIHGAGIVRDAAGRGLRVALAEQGDLASATSSASSKLAHGGLRYLEHGDFRLVREALHERDVLMRIAPHLVRPLPFFLPAAGQVRPAWQIWAGLLLYDLLAGRSHLPRSRSVDLSRSSEGALLKPEFRRGFCYFDGWADDARLVVANALDASRHGALVLTRTRCQKVAPLGQGWQACLAGQDGEVRTVTARAVVNATGPWVDAFLRECTPVKPRARARLVKGSHIVVRRRILGGRALLLQNDDRRVVFVIPFEGACALIGTTDVAIDRVQGATTGSDAEVDYLCRAVNRYLAEPVAPNDIVWTFSGVRALYDDGHANPAEITRDYVLQVDQAGNGASMVSIFGGKLTTYRRLAEETLGKLATAFPSLGPAWTASRPLPGGEVVDAHFEAWSEALVARYPRLPSEWVRALAHRHGTLAKEVLGDAQVSQDLGTHFGAGLTSAEVDYFVHNEWAREPEDVLWRRSKVGLHMDQAQRQAIADYLSTRELAT